MTLLDAEGRALGTAPARGADETGFLMRTTPTARGWLAAWITALGESMPRGQPFRETVSIRPFDRLNGTLDDEVFSYAMPERRLSRGEIPFSVQPYFQANPVTHIGADGSIDYTPGGTYHIERYETPSGRLTRRITADPAPAPIGASLLDRAAETERASFRDAPTGTESALYLPVIDERKALGVADNLPVLGRMHGSAGGWLLVERLDLDPDPVASGDATTWDLFGPDGLLAGRLALGGDQRILALTDDGFLGVDRDELDVEAFVKYRFEGLP
jgi:hypothetical protein